MSKIFVNGTFDIVHCGHIQLLNYAKSLGTHLLVAIDTDDRVKKLKGITRPVNNENDRLYFLSNIKSVDQVLLFGSDNELKNIIQQYQPDIMIVGSDYKNKPVIGNEYAQKLIFFDRIKPYSTSKIIQSMLKDNKNFCVRP